MAEASCRLHHRSEADESKPSERSVAGLADELTQLHPRLGVRRSSPGRDSH